MNKKISVGAAITMAAIAAILAFAITWFVSSSTFDQLISGSSNSNDIQRKIKEIDGIVSDNYVGEFDINELIDSLARCYVSGINDQFATYYSADEFKTRQQEQEGYMTGIGISAAKNDEGYIVISSIHDDSPADKAGIEVGDLIVEVEGEDVQSLGFSSAIDKIKGEEGTSVNITVRHDGEDKAYELTRAKIELKTVSYKMLDDYGYIQVTSFKDITVSQFEEALTYVENQGAKGIIFDMRNNGGGTVNSVVDVMNKILPEGTLGHYEYKDGSTKELGKSDKEYVELPIVVLTNSSTASAAELFAANVRDFERGSLVGTTTFGKGVSQSLITLSDGSALSLTTAYFNPAKGTNFNGVGIEPDYEIALSDEDAASYAAGTLEPADDQQLQKAVEVLKSTQR